jgi:hypothetical protein
LVFLKHGIQSGLRVKFGAFVVADLLAAAAEDKRSKKEKNDWFFHIKTLNLLSVGLSYHGSR